MNEEIQNYKTLIGGLETRRDDLIISRDLFLKVQGLDEQIEKERQKIGELETDIESTKESLSEYQGQKSEAIRGTMLEITKKMNQVLPTGEGCIQIDDDGVQIGWFKDNVFRPYHGLSGSEEKQFGMALAYVLLGDSKNKVLICEAAEIDKENLTAALDHWGKLKDTQLIVNTCHAPEEVPKGWNLITL